MKQIFYAEELKGRFPEAHDELPEIYQAEWTDNSLIFWLDSEGLHGTHQEGKKVGWEHYATWCPYQGCWIRREAA